MQLAATIAWILGYLYKWGLDIITIVIVLGLYIICPFNLPLTISATKDVIFTVALLNLTFSIVRMMYEKDHYWERKINIVHFILSGIGTSLLRSNGMVATLFVVAFVLMHYLCKSKKAIASALVVLMLLLLVKLPLYSFLQVKSGAQGMASYPFIDGVWTNLAFDNILDDETLVYLDDIMPIELWKENYKMKFTNVFVLDHTKLDTKRSVKAWLWCVQNYPLTTLRSRLCKTQFIWSVFQNEDTYYSYNISVESHPKSSEYGWFYNDTTEKYRDLYCKYFGTKPFYSLFLIIGNGGWNIFICLLLISSLVAQKKKYKIYSLLPIAGSTLALLLCSCFSDYRYIWPVFVMMLIFMPLVFTKDKGELVCG